MNQPTATPFMTPARTLAVLLAVFYIVVMTPLLGKKYGYTVDATPSFQLTKAMVERGEWLPEEIRVKQGYIYSVVFIPFYLAGKAVEPLFSGVGPDWVQRKMMCWMNIVFAALTLALIARTLDRMGFTLRAQCITALAYGFATFALAYARYDYNKTFAGLLLIAFFYWYVCSFQSRRILSLAASAVFLGLLIALRAEMALIAVAAGLDQLRLSFKRREAPWLALAALIPAGLGIAWVLLQNWLLWGGGAAGGYTGSFLNNPLTGLIGFLGSPGKSIFLFCPALFLLPLMVRPFAGYARESIWMWSAAILLMLALYSAWQYWWGGWGWGPRHLVPLTPLLILPLAAAVDMRDARMNGYLALLIAAGVFVNTLGILFDFNDVILFLDNQGVTEEQIIWQPLVSQIYHHWRFAMAAPLERWDLGWLWLAGRMPAGLFYALFAAWLAVAGSLAAGMIWMIARPRDAQ